MFLLGVIALALTACVQIAPAVAPTREPPPRPSVTARATEPTASPTPSPEVTCTPAADEYTRESPSCGQPNYGVPERPASPTVAASFTPTATVTSSPTPSASATASATIAPPATPTETPLPPAAFAPISENVRIAVIGDFGLTNPREADVAALVQGWAPDAIFTVGDNNYPFGSAETIDLNIGQYYAGFIAPYLGVFGLGAAENRFFPALGNHDWMTDSAQPYLDYFTLPGNERYYEVRLGPTHWFVLDSQPDEPDGITADSTQATWLRGALAASDAPWKLVILHHPPYSSGPHDPLTQLRWPFAEWGATAVLSGHDHIYERILRDGIVYFVDGLGGTVTYDIGNPVEGSQARFNEDFGAMLIEAAPDRITFQFVTRAGVQVDAYTINR